MGKDKAIARVLGRLDEAIAEVEDLRRELPKLDPYWNAAYARTDAHQMGTAAWAKDTHEKLLEARQAALKMRETWLAEGT